MFFPSSRIATIVGHYGSGKSEIAINIALLFAAKNMTKDTKGVEDTKVIKNTKVYLADLDIVNPYFRSREAADFLLEKNIEVIQSAEDFSAVDLPYMPSEIEKIFQDENCYGVIDAGGDPAGARVLARYSDKLTRAGAEVYFVVNANRPLTKSSDEAIKYMNDIQGAANIRITGIINNTHLLNKTEARDILSGVTLAEELSERTGIPVVAHAVEKSLADELERSDVIPKIFPIDIHLRKPWEIV